MNIRFVTYPSFFSNVIIIMTTHATIQQPTLRIPEAHVTFPVVTEGEILKLSTKPKTEHFQIPLNLKLER